MIDEELELTSLIPLEKLQELQNGFSEMTGMATGISDANGNPVTEPSKSCDFCSRLTKGSEQGRERCIKCDREGGELAFKEGRAVVYVCHAGLVDCSAPIMVDGTLIGSFNSGQVRVGALDVEKVKKTAQELGIDEDEYVSAAWATQEMDAGKLLQTMNFVYTVTNSLSDMAYKQYQLQKASEEVAKAAQMKSDFLANMSHEIRTPMNGVIGMAELALREELPPAARDYINQIKASGKTLLAIINDILDFSKIESGKLDIHEEEYEPMSLVHDVSNIIMTRIGDKPVELSLDIPPNLPYKLHGDSIRIKQSLINLANNAVKFTEQGQVLIRIAYEWLDDENIDLQVTVKDTGIGIKEEDLKRIFMSFQQVDSKRNRQIEGTGLGLAITQQLVHLMKGEVTVESEYGKGSVFAFHIPQKVVDKKQSVYVDQTIPPVVAVITRNNYMEKQIISDLERLGCKAYAAQELSEIQDETKIEMEFLFVDHELFTVEVQEYAKAHPQITVVVMIDFRKKAEYPINNVVVMKKPFYVLNIANILKHETELNTQQSDDDFKFTAPDAHILVVDDNAINLTVTEGLLEPLKMQIDTAMSGKEAIDKISQIKYDLVFMDHMMPELDGVETTRIIRRFHPEYDDVPIIALTANVIDGTKEMFIQEGMNDFVPKPVEIRMMVSKLHHWLPLEKQIRADNLNLGEEEKKTDLEIEGLDVEYALSILGSEKLYWSVLEDYYKVIDKKIQIIRDAYAEGDFGRYTIEVHALKSASKQIGAMELSEMAAELEKAGNARDLSVIAEMTENMLYLYKEYEEILSVYFVKEEEETEQVAVSAETLLELIGQMEEALENLDMDTIESITGDMKAYRLEDGQKEIFDALQSAVGDYEMETCEELLKQWKNILN